MLKWGSADTCELLLLASLGRGPVYRWERPQGTVAREESLRTARRNADAPAHARCYSTL